MEKIYTQEKKKQKNSNMNKQSILSSVSIALVAIFALIIVGFNQISFAIPEQGSTLGESFVSAEIDTPGRILGETSSFVVTQFKTKDGEIVFCLERDITYKPDLEYNKDISINDAGLIYLMANLYPNVKFKDDLGADLPTGVQVWLSQSAIWTYVAQNNYPNNETMTTELINGVAAEKRLYDASMNTVLEITQGDINAGKTTLYKKYGIDKLLSDANNLRNLPANKIDVTKKSDIISLTADEKFYQTDFISVVGTVSSDKIGAFKGYQLNLNKVPDGTIVIGEDGNEIKDLSNLAAGTKFALRVPVSNVKEDNKELQISVLGSFDTFAANKYIYKGTENAPSQTVTNVKRINNNLSAPLSIQLNYTPTVPNTAMSNSTTLFFIGIILLLSGLGIFYTSAKKD